jgi:hypothetical protein
MVVCENAEKRYADASLVLCVNSSHYAEIKSTSIPFRLILPLLDEYNNSEMKAIELIASIADTISAGRIIIERDENEIAVAFYR